MKLIRIIFFTLLLGLVLSQTPLTAQTDSQYVRFGGGISFNQEPDGFTDYWNNAWMATINYGFPVYFEFALELDATFQHYSFKEDEFLQDLGVDPATVSIEGTSVQIYTVFLNGVFQPEWAGPLIPYAKAGLGLFALREDDMVITGVQGSFAVFGDDLIEYGFGFQVQAGVDYFINPRTAVFAQGGMQQGYPGGETVRVFPVTAGMRFGVN